MRHWLIKFAPFRTSWAGIVRAGTFTLRGVRSPEACKHLAAMALADQVLFYHSQQERAVVGVLEVSREAYPDPTSADPRWLTCDFRPLQTLARPVPLEEIRQDSSMAGLPLLRQPRLAVMPLSPADFMAILSMSATNPESTNRSGNGP
jgi:predicted RNA-binding protein with PUA-like domain